MRIDIRDLKNIVLEAGELARLYYGKVTKSLKADLSVVTEADTAIEEFLKPRSTALLVKRLRKAAFRRPARTMPGSWMRSMAAAPLPRACRCGRPRSA
jgi:hypothetical protein